jgi:hypothetical protein
MHDTSLNTAYDSFCRWRLGPGSTALRLMARQKLGELCGSFGSSHSESGFPRTFVVIEATPPAFHDYFGVRKFFAPECCPNFWDLWHSLYWFDSKQCAVLFVREQIQQSVWTLPHLTDSLFELSQE